MVRDDRDQDVQQLQEFVVGPTLELHLPLGFSFEADGLYRQQNLTEVFTVPSITVTLIGTSITSTTLSPASTDVSSWEISTLGKFTFPTAVVKPYIAAGPSFRATGSQLNNYLSDRGITGAAGVNVRIRNFQLGREFRFTHWGNDPVPNAVPTLRTGDFSGSLASFLLGTTSYTPFVRSARNQVELLKPLAKLIWHSEQKM